MSKARISIAAVVGLLILSAVTQASAQITINLPRIPKIKKDKPVTTTTTTTSDPLTTTTSNATRSNTETASKPKDCSNDPVAQVHLKDLGETREEAESFTPGSRDYFVSTLSDRKNLYLEAAMLPKERQAWLGPWPAEFQKCIGDALDGLAAAAKKTIGGFTGPAGYTNGTPAERKVLLTAINDISEAKVLKSGIKQPNWLIAKDNYNFPTARYKHGYVLVQYPNRDHGGLCWLFWINIVQDYAGGGTYAASYGNFISRALAGCPAK